MRPARNILLNLVFCALFMGSVSAGVRAETQKPFYIAPETLPPSLLIPPPTEGTVVAHKDVQAVIAAQKHISESDRAALVNEQHMRLELMTDVMGAHFTREQYPKTFALLDHVLSDAAAITEKDKFFWHIRRPYLVDHRVKLLVDPIDASPAYPSGHTSESRVIAEVLGLLYPDHLTDLRTHANVIAWHRVEAGVHYPTDLEGGRMLAMLMTGAFLQSDDFQNDLAAARAEIAQER